MTGCICKKVSTVTDLKNKITTSKEKINSYLNEIDNNISHENVFTGVAFTSFKDSQEYSNYYEIFPHSYIQLLFKQFHYFFAFNICCCCYSNRRKNRLQKAVTLKVELAPEPSDIIWENLEYSTKDRVLRKLYSYFISILLIIISFSIVVGLNYLQVNISIIKKKNYKTENNSINYGISSGISLSISVINYFISSFLRKITV